MFVVHYDKDGIQVTLRRPDRLQDIRGMLYVKALRDMYPESRYSGKQVMVEGQMQTVYDPYDKELADTLNKSFEHWAFVMACLTELSGLPYAVPEIKDSTMINTAYTHFMTEDGQKLYYEWANMVKTIKAPLTDVVQKPAEHLTEDERNDPLSVAPVLSSIEQ